MSLIICSCVRRRSTARLPENLVCYCTISIPECIEMLRNLPPVKQTRKRRGDDYSARLGSGCLLRFRGDSSDDSAPPLFARLRDVGDVCGAME